MTTATDTITEIKFKIPPQYIIIMYNDDYTPQDFVIEILVHIFQYSIDDAIAKTAEIHGSEYSVVGKYNHEMATQKKYEVDLVSKQMNHPLRVDIKPE